LAVAARALDLAREAGSSRLEAEGYALVGSINLSRGMLRDAEENLQRALTIARAYGDPGEQLHYLQILAQLSVQAGQTPAAIKHLRQALEVATVDGSPEMRARLHGQLARLYQSNNHLAAAEEHYRGAVIAAEEAGSQRFLARALRGLATVRDAAGKADAAIETYVQALKVTEELGDRASAAILHYNLGALLYDRQEDDQARRHLDKAIEQAMMAGDFATSDAARELLRWLNAPGNGGQPDAADDLLLGEIAVGDGSEPLPDLFRESRLWLANRPHNLCLRPLDVRPPVCESGPGQPVTEADPHTVAEIDGSAEPRGAAAGGL